MRYKLDINGYVDSVYFGCYGNGCTEYTGKIPTGYSSLIEWSTNALINAYYLDTNGNLILDADREAELLEKIEQEDIENTPILYKDLYGTNEVLDSQYQKETSTGKVVAIDNVKRTNPKVKLTNINCYSYNKVDIISQGKQMLRNDAKTETIAGVMFTKNIDGSIKINGTSTEKIEYNLSGSSLNASPIFVLKKEHDYYLNIGGFDCEMKYYNGETTEQIYIGASGVVNLVENKQVTQVLLKIPTGTTVDTTIYPMLEYGTTTSEYEEYKARILTIDFKEFISEGIFPSDELYPSDELFPKGTTIDYIYIENGIIYISANGVLRYLTVGNVNLFNGYNTIYTLQETDIEITYSVNALYGSFYGDVYYEYNGKKIVEKGAGLLTTKMIDSNIKSKQFLGGSCLLPMGFSQGENNDFTKDFLEFAFEIPDDFTIVSSYIILDHVPVKYSNSGIYERTGYSRNLKLYKSTSKLDSALTYEYGYYNIDSDSKYSEIPNAFNGSSFTGSAVTGSSAKSIDITSSIDKGFNLLKIESDYAKPTTFIESQERSGACKATLYINGYTKFN